MLNKTGQQVFDYYREYQDAEFIPASIRKEINYVYEAYQSLGGNNTGSRIYELLKAKPINPALSRKVCKFL